MRASRAYLLALLAAGLAGFGVGSAMADPPEEPAADDPAEHDPPACLPEHDDSAGSPGEFTIPVDKHPCWVRKTPISGGPGLDVHEILVGYGWGRYLVTREPFAELYQGAGNDCSQEVGSVPAGDWIRLRLGSAWNIDSTTADGGNVMVDLGILQFINGDCTGAYAFAEYRSHFRSTTAANIDWADTGIDSAPFDQPDPGDGELCFDLRLRTCVCNAGVYPDAGECLAATLPTGCTARTAVKSGRVHVTFL